MKKMLVTMAAFLLGAAAVFAQGPVISDESTVVNTVYGKVQGYLDGNVYTFKGIPYAEAERFMPPTAPKVHEGTLMCRRYGPVAPQNLSLNYNGNWQSDYDFGFQFKIEPMSEEHCLVLNVWSKGINDGKKRPVFVWFHGGGFVNGSAVNLPTYEGRALAEKGDIVVVSVNHRLNVLGYFDMSGLGGRFSESVNLGQQDLVKSLEWINKNIERFGGDPDCVTIAGQSGGGGKVSTVMMMPSAKGLFHRAIVQSGSYVRYQTNEDSKLYANALLNELGIKADDKAALDAVPYDELVEAANKAVRMVNAALEAKGLPAPGGNNSPVIDGKYVVGPGFDQKAPEISADVPMIIGWNYNEFDYATGKEDIRFRDGAINQANVKSSQGKAPVYLYMFNWKPAGNVLGACHGMELAFMFNNIALQTEMNGGTREAYELSDKMSSAWINFIKTGDPNVKGLPNWQPYTEKKGTTMIFDYKCTIRKK